MTTLLDPAAIRSEHGSVRERLRHVEHRAYDRDGRQTSQTLSHDAAPQAGLTYDYNPADQLVEQAETGALNATRAFSYEAQGRIAADSGTAFEHDPA